MPGSEWNQLVAAPTVTEIDAALAGVRVRAVPLARRRARNRRMRSALGTLAFAGAAFWAGSLASGNGITLGARAAWDQNGFRGAPELARDDAAPRLVSPALAEQTWRITTWEELEGEKFGQRVLYATGPEGTGFGLRIDDQDGGEDLTAIVIPRVRPDSVTISIESFLRRRIGTSARGLDLFEEGTAGGYKTTARGGAIMLYPFGHRYAKRGP